MYQHHGNKTVADLKCSRQAASQSNKYWNYSGGQNYCITWAKYSNSLTFYCFEQN